MSSSVEDAVLLYYIRCGGGKIGAYDAFGRNIKHNQRHALQDLVKYPEKFHKYFRMSMESFDVLLDLVAPRIQRIRTNWREPISPRERLSITTRLKLPPNCIRVLFCGISTIAQIIPETCDAIWSALQAHFMPVPDEEQWEGIARWYYELWNAPNCIGSDDGKHIRVRSYDHSGSSNFNYLHYFSTVLMASADADALFITIDFGAPSRNSDGGGAGFQRTVLTFLPLPGDETGTPFPYYFCADEAFPLRENIMRPYPRRTLSNTRRVCNYRFSRARKSIEWPDDLEYEKPHVTCIDDDRTGRAKGCHWREILANYFVHVSLIPYQWASVVGEPAEAAAMFHIFYRKQSNWAISLQHVVLKQLVVREIPGSFVAVSLQFPLSTNDYRLFRVK
ncbi:hypothetical protein PR048_032457 [Dryococelus australis]|uniref:DDE Tnp4 domain-containing protein n=1 Tax=Dryococelus australis TaxID=614101 RepID=A0ABQ9G3F1_9NEOP|nr:hypothetical protein PR048_032457 [Dryococelus australis]